MAIRLLDGDQSDAGTVRIRIVRLLPTAVVALDGDLSLRAVDAVRDALLGCLSECPDAVVVDVGGLHVTRNLPLAVFRAVRRRAAAWPAVPMLLCSPRPALRARLVRTGMDRTLPIHHTRAAALAAVAAGPTAARADRELPPTLDAPARARDFIWDTCLAWHVPELIDPARLVVSELVTNAVLHAHSRPRVTAVLRRGDLHLIVRDRSPAPPRQRPVPAGAGPTAPSGRGLYLVDRAADSWGHLASTAGKAVWAVFHCR